LNKPRFRTFGSCGMELKRVNFEYKIVRINKTCSAVSLPVGHSRQAKAV